MPRIHTQGELWKHPVLQSCGHTAEADDFRERVLRTCGPAEVRCKTCYVPVAPWAPPNHALSDPTFPERWRDIIAPFPAERKYDAVSALSTYGVIAQDPEKIKESLTAQLHGTCDEVRVGYALKMRSEIYQQFEDFKKAHADLAAAVRIFPSDMRHGVSHLHWQLSWQLEECSRRLPSLANTGAQSGLQLGTDAPTPLPEGFGTCLIIPELMYEPVSLTCGHTYERENLFRTKDAFFCSTCQCPAMRWHIPNLEVRSVIEASQPTWDEPLPRHGFRLSDPMPMSAFDFDKLKADAQMLLNQVQTAFNRVNSRSGTSKEAKGWLSDLARALRLYPQLADARVLRAHIHLWAGDTTSALADLADAAHKWVDFKVCSFLSIWHENNGTPALLALLENPPINSEGFLAQWRSGAERFIQKLIADKGRDESLSVHFPRLLRVGEKLDCDICTIAWQAIHEKSATLQTLCGSDDTHLRAQLMRYVAHSGRYEVDAVNADWRINDDVCFREIESQAFLEDKAQVWCRYVGNNVNLSMNEAVPCMIAALKALGLRAADTPQDEQVLAALTQANNLALRCAQQGDAAHVTALAQAINAILPGSTKLMTSWANLVSWMEHLTSSLRELTPDTIAAIRNDVRQAKDCLPRRFSGFASKTPWEQLLRSQLQTIESKIAPKPNYFSYWLESLYQSSVSFFTKMGTYIRQYFYRHGPDEPQ